MRQIINVEDSSNQINLDRLINDPLISLDKSDKDYNKKVLEICHVGKFLMLLNSGFQISEIREQPDFVIEKSNHFKVGLEHEILVDPVLKKIEGSFADIVNSVEVIFRERHPETKLLVNIYVNINKKISKKDKPRHIETLLTIVEDYIFQKKLVKNDLVRKIYCHNHSELNFYCNPGGWCQQVLQKEELIKSILQKEEKIVKYISNSELDEQWLLIVIGSLSQSSYEIDSKFEVNLDINSRFNRIFLMEDFNARLFELKCCLKIT